MLYKNDVIVELHRFQKDVDELKEHFHNKFPVKVVYPPERIVKSRLPHNRLPDKPNSISFDLKSVVKTKIGVEVWRYAEEVVVDNQGNKRYTPKKFRFNGLRYLQETDIELIFFLYLKSEYCLGGKNQGKLVKFTFEDPIGEAERKALRKVQDLKIGKLIYSDDDGLPEEKLRAVARAFFIKNVDEYTLAQVRVTLDLKIGRTKDGVKKFLAMIQNDDELNSRVYLQNAIDKKIIFYDDGTRKWFWNSDEGKTKLICNVPPSKSTYDTLIDLYMGDESFQGDVKASLINASPKRKKVIAGVSPDADE